MDTNTTPSSIPTAQDADEKKAQLPSLVRLKRVDYCLQKTGLCSTETRTFTKGAKSLQFSTTVWDIVEALGADSKDPCGMSADDVRKYAQEKLGKPAPKVPADKKEAKPSREIKHAGCNDAKVQLIIGVYALLLSALEVAKKDRSTGSEERFKELDALAGKYSDAMRPRQEQDGTSDHDPEEEQVADEQLGHEDGADDGHEPPSVT